MRISLTPIGIVRSQYTNTAEIPKGLGAQHEASGIIEVHPEFEDGLKDIEGFSHLYVIWVFDRAQGSSLTAYPPSDDRPHGVFATRSPERPNPIGLTVVTLIGRDGPNLRVRGIECSMEPRSSTSSPTCRTCRENSSVADGSRKPSAGGKRGHNRPGPAMSAPELEA